MLPENLIVSGHPVTATWAGPELSGARDVRIGIWTCEIGSMRSDSYPNDEVFTIHKGLVKLEADDGNVLEVREGDSCFIPEGWRGIWHTVQPTCKTYNIFTHAES